ncbi:type II toxin-antitoxin system RelE/ParE family toxin [Anaerotaenia torta]|uniref:type II toxin-antitoxin system RelE/ParE family toxin n=1 Tax=Anaerotaenia torta TaxID=433293 RepID=UPI003D1BD84B
MTKSFRNLQQFENRGPSVEGITGIPCDYRFLYVQHNYAFYRVGDDTIWIIDIYNEKEDFMWKLFGIKQPVKRQKITGMSSGDVMHSCALPGRRPAGCMIYFREQHLFVI